MNFTRKKTGLFAALLTCLLAWQGGAAAETPQPNPVGAWALALDAGPFGIPGFALQGAATFHRDGTVTIIDAGDFGSLGTLDTAQLGVWRRTSDGILARTLLLSADPATGEPLLWQRVTFRLSHGADADHMVGTINVEMLACPASPLPGAVTCPNPVLDSAGFVPSGPADVPIEFHRHTVVD
jgi:hypothetical protein